MTKRTIALLCVDTQRPKQIGRPRQHLQMHFPGATFTDMD